MAEQKICKSIGIIVRRTIGLALWRISGFDVHDNKYRCLMCWKVVWLNGYTLITTSDSPIGSASPRVGVLHSCCRAAFLAVEQLRTGLSTKFMDVSGMIFVVPSDDGSAAFDAYSAMVKRMVAEAE